jgi:hypothetical protein
VLLEEIEAATHDWDAKQKEARRASSVNLLLGPNPRAFELTKDAKAEADEGAAQNYLRVSTRMGDDSRAALILDDAEMFVFARTSLDAEAKSPRREKLRALFGCKVNLPKALSQFSMVRTGCAATS